MSKVLPRARNAETCVMIFDLKEQLFYSPNEIVQNQ